MNKRIIKRTLKHIRKIVSIIKYVLILLLEWKLPHPKYTILIKHGIIGILKSHQTIFSSGILVKRNTPNYENNFHWKMSITMFLVK